MREPTKFFTRAAIRRQRRQQFIEAVLVAAILLGVAAMLSILIYFWGATS